MAKPRKSTPHTDAYSYLRFSRPEQSGGDSVRRQTEARERWLADHPDVRLDTGLALEDRGVGGWTGQHRSDPDRYALARFTELFRAGAIRKGSYLLVENLDRLSRESAGEAVQFFLELVNGGIVVVQLLPTVVEFRRPVEMMPLMWAVMELSRGHQESQIKSERCGRAWHQKKVEAAETKEPVTRIVPCWLTVLDRPKKGNGGRFVVRKDAAAVVRRIYKMARDGVGMSGIVKTLNTDKTPTITGNRGHNRGKHWSLTFIKQVLSMEQVYGVYRPMKGKSKRVPDGEPIRDYYPAILTEAEYLATRATLASRRRLAGRVPTTSTNLFRGLLRDVDTGTDWNWRGKGRRPATYVPQKWRQGTAPMNSIPVHFVEEVLLGWLREIDPADILPGTTPSVTEADALAGRLSQIEATAAQTQARLSGGDGDVFLLDVLAKLGREKAQITDRLAHIKQEAATPVSAAWTDTRTLLAVLDSAPDKEAARLKLRAALRRIIDRIDMAVRREGHCRTVHVSATIHFRGGAARNLAAWLQPRTARRPEAKGYSAVWDGPPVHHTPGVADPKDTRPTPARTGRTK